MLRIGGTASLYLALQFGEAPRPPRSAKEEKTNDSKQEGADHCDSRLLCFE